MERIGERLRKRREELGLTLEDVSETIRYRPEIIRAVEEGRTNVFPAKAYSSAFLRAYAAILELDPADIVRDQKSEEERAFEAIRSIRLKPKRRRKFPRRVLYVLVPIVLAAVMLIVVDRFVWDREPATSTEALDRPLPGMTGVPWETRDTSDVHEREGAGDEETPAGPVEPSGEVKGSEIPEVTSGEGAARYVVAPAERGSGARGEETKTMPPSRVESPAPAGAPVEEAQAVGLEDTQPEDGSDVAPVSADEAEPEIPPRAAEAPGGPRRHKLVVSARRGAYLNLMSGGREIYNGYFGGGEVDSFFSEDRFVIVAITDRGAWTFVQDGERVHLPGSSSKDASNFVIPLPSGE